MKTELAPVNKWQESAQKVHNLVAERQKKTHWSVSTPQPMALAVWQVTHDRSASSAPWRWGISYPESFRHKCLFSPLAAVSNDDTTQSMNLAQGDILAASKTNNEANSLSEHFSHFIQQVVLAHEAPVLERAQAWLSSAIVEASITHSGNLPLTLSELLETSQKVQWWDTLDHEPGRRKMVIAHAMLVSDFFHQRVEDLPDISQWADLSARRHSKEWGAIEQAWATYFHRWAVEHVLNRSARAVDEFIA